MRRATVLATVVLVMGALAAPAMAVAPDDVPDEGAADIARIAGATRYHTAADTAVQSFPDGADTVLVATGEKFPDALAASFLAGIGGEASAPIVLVRPDEVPSPTAAALDQLAPTNLVVLGQQDAVDQDTYDELAEIVGDDNIDRLGGGTRIETAAMIAAQGGDVGTMADQSGETEDELKTAIVARADQFPDALASGPLALAGRHPIVLTHTDELPQATIDVLTDADLGIEQVIITGGPVAVSEDVEDEIAGLDSIVNVSRVAGAIRTETAVELAKLTRTSLGWDATDIALARGDNFPDALTLAPRAAQLNASLFLSRNPQTIEGHTFAGIQALCGEVQDLLITGGPVAISADAEGEAKLATLCADHTFPISADQETEDGKEGAEGTGWITIQGDTICTVYDVQGLEGNANASHIHEAVEGSDGDIVLDLGVPNAEGFLATCDVDADLAADIEANPAAYYVNIHTPTFPLGAARGQVDGTEDLSVALAGENEVDPDTGEFVSDPAAGEGNLDLFFGEGELCYEVSVSGLSSPVDTSIAGGFHIHQGAVNANGDIVVPMPLMQSATDFTAYDCVQVDQDQLDAITDSPQDFYANLHTVDNPAGALRGQLGADAEFMMFGDAVVDDTGAEPVFGGGVDGLVGDVRLFHPAPDTICVDVTLPADAGDVDGMAIRQGAVDEDSATDLVTFDPPVVGAPTCESGVEAAVTAVAADVANHYLTVSIAGSEAARGQVAADAMTQLMPTDEDGNITALGTAKLYDGSNADVLCGSVDIVGAASVSDVTVTAADDSEVASLDITAPIDFGCDTEAADAEADLVTVVTPGGNLTGQFS